MKYKPSFIETIAEKLGLIENLHPSAEDFELPRMKEPGEFRNYPPEK